MGSRFSFPLRGNKFSEDNFLRDYPLDPSLVSVYFNNFNAGQDYAATDWVVTETGAAGTQGIAPQELGGALELVNATLDNDSVELQASSDGGTAVSEHWALNSGKQFWLACRFKSSDADNSCIVIGIVITDTTIIDAPTDGLYFELDDGSTKLSAIAQKDTSKTTLPILDMVDDIYSEVGLHFDGNGTVTVFKRNNDNTDLKDKFIQIGTLTTNLPDDEQLALSIAFQNGRAGTISTNIDYIFLAQER